MRTLLPPALLLFVSCATEGEDSSGGEAVVVVVTSPKDGERFSEDDVIDLEVQLKQGGKLVDARTVVWTVGDLTERGASTFVEASRLDAGEVDVSVDVNYGGKQYNQQLTITVAGQGEDTGKDTGKDTGQDTGTDPGSIAYTGTMASHIWYDGEYGEFDGDCPGTVDFVIDEAGAVVGTGWCVLDGEYDFYYTLDGTQGRGSISGSLILVGDDGTEYSTPFSGTGTDGSTQEASWDKTFRTGGDSLRIAGSFVADPV